MVGVAVGVDGRRVAEVLADFAVTGSPLRGSGFLLRADVLVTAWHLVAGAERVRAVFEAGTERTHVAVMRSAPIRLGRSDVALVVLDGVRGDIVPVTLGGFGDRPAVIDAEAFGFPLFRVRTKDGSSPPPGQDQAKYRALAHEDVRLSPQANWRAGECALLVAGPADAADGVSPWAGMSGGPVFARGGWSLVAVVTDDHPADGLGRLTAARLDLVLAQLPAAQLRQVLPLLGLDSVELPPVWQEPGELVRAAYTNVAHGFLPRGGLRDRADELAALKSFCAGSQSYVYWQAPAKAGKTALMATFAANPPAGITVVAFFNTAVRADQSDSTAFTGAMLDQLAALTGEHVPQLRTAAARDGYLTELLKRAAATCVAAGGRLVMLVDGLDEDTSASRNMPSLASLLPHDPIPGLKVMVAGRPDPPLPADIRRMPDHPLHSCVRHGLEPSPYAAELMHSAESELEHIIADSLGATVTGLVLASGGGLTIADLHELTDMPVFDLRRLLTGHGGRTIAARADPAGGSGYVFTHETLRLAAQDLISTRHRQRYRDQIRAWATDYARRQWPDETPDYLLRIYQRTLDTDQPGDIQQLATFAADAARHDRMHHRTGGDHTAYTEIQTALKRLADADNPKMRTIVRIARHRDALQQRNRHIPAELPAVWARLGEHWRAEALARSITDAGAQMRALASLAAVLAPVYPDRARRLANDAEQAAHRGTGIFEARS
ncbi:serine protease, partial [Hamadaea sp. NPDC051192]|uniref:S1 family peptidase n=1 Tax=Hamadaea sp. NPDC051192 TaxID=3154940 RepID=UPI00342ADA60